MEKINGILYKEKELLIEKINNKISINYMINGKIKQKIVNLN